MWRIRTGSSGLLETPSEPLGEFIICPRYVSILDPRRAVVKRCFAKMSTLGFLRAARVSKPRCPFGPGKARRDIEGHETPGIHPYFRRSGCTVVVSAPRPTSWFLRAARVSKRLYGCR